MRGRDGGPVLLAGPWPEALRDRLVALLRELPGLAGLSGSTEEVRPLVDLLDRPVASTDAQLLLRCDELIEPAPIPGRPIIADESHRWLVRDWFVRFADEAAGLGPSAESAAEHALATSICRLWLDRSGTPVTLAVQQPGDFGSARIGPVYTPTEHRGHGFASATTAVATRAILRDGDVPVLFTEVGNTTSNKIYRALGYQLVCENLAVGFG